MTEWKVEFHDRFKGEITDLPADVRVELLAHLVLLRETAPKGLEGAMAVRLCLRSGAEGLWFSAVARRAV